MSDVTVTTWNRYILTWLSSKESILKKQFIPPTTLESFTYVDNVCATSSHRRKQEARNRAMFGMGRQAQVQAAPIVPFEVPSSWSCRTSPGQAVSPGLETISGSDVLDTDLHRRVQTAAALASGLQPNVSADAVDQSLSCSPNELGTKELKTVAKGCLAYLEKACGVLNQELLTLPLCFEYMAFLATSTLCFGLAPRSQVLQALALGSSFIKEGAQYVVRMLAEQNKNRKPTLFPLPPDLTAPFDMYLNLIRPYMLHAHQQKHSYVFIKKDGSGPRSDFSQLTNVVTQRLLQRPVNAHAFRAALVTTYYREGQATTSNMTVLARIMAHCDSTQRSFYIKHRMMKEAMNINSKMVDVLKGGQAKDEVHGHGHVS